MLVHRVALPLLVVLAACVFGPLEPAAEFRAGVYSVDVTIDDGCGQVAISDTPLDCVAGLEVDADGALHTGWPEVDGTMYVVNDGLLPEVATSPVRRWSTSATEPSEACDGAALRWVVSLSNDGEGEIAGSLRNTWTGVTGCPITPAMPATECTTTFAYRYTLEEPCDAPCTLVEADATADGPYDCGLAACSCP